MDGVSQDSDMHMAWGLNWETIFCMTGSLWKREFMLTEKRLNEFEIRLGLRALDRGRQWVTHGRESSSCRDRIWIGLELTSRRTIIAPPGRTQTNR